MEMYAQQNQRRQHDFGREDVRRAEGLHMGQVFLVAFQTRRRVGVFAEQVQGLFGEVRRKLSAQVRRRRAVLRRQRVKIGFRARQRHQQTRRLFLIHGDSSLFAAVDLSGYAFQIAPRNGGVFRVAHILMSIKIYRHL